MQYKDLKEMTIKEWDGEQFDAYVQDVESAQTLVDIKKTIVGYQCGRWVTDSGCPWCHVYPVEWNKDKVEEALNPKYKRMTNRQLAMWIAKGIGEWKLKNGCRSFTAFDYNDEDSSKLAGNNVEVRKWDSDEWVEPVVDLLEGV